MVLIQILLLLTTQMRDLKSRLLELNNTCGVDITVVVGNHSDAGPEEPPPGVEGTLRVPGTSRGDWTHASWVVTL